MGVYAEDIWLGGVQLCGLHQPAKADAMDILDGGGHMKAWGAEDSASQCSMHSMALALWTPRWAWPGKQATSPGKNLHQDIWAQKWQNALRSSHNRMNLLYAGIQFSGAFGCYASQRRYAANHPNLQQISAARLPATHGTECMRSSGPAHTAGTAQRYLPGGVEVAGQCPPQGPASEGGGPVALCGGLGPRPKGIVQVPAPHS